MPAEILGPDLGPTRENLLIEGNPPDPMFSGKWISTMAVAFDRESENGIQFPSHEVVLACADSFEEASEAGRRHLNNLGIEVDAPVSLHLHPEGEGSFTEVE